MTVITVWLLVWTNIGYVVPVGQFPTQQECHRVRDIVVKARYSPNSLCIEAKVAK
jgi:hypothetical protein